MKLVTFNGKEYVHICYEDNNLITNEQDSLDYISKTLYGAIKIQVRTISEDKSDDLKELIRYVRGKNILQQEVRMLESEITTHIGNKYHREYPIYINGISCFSFGEDVFVSYCYKMESPLDYIFFLLEDFEGSKICYEYYNTRNRKFIELGSFALYKNKKEDGVKFFPFTKIATRFQDFVF